MRMGASEAVRGFPVSAFSIYIWAFLGAVLPPVRGSTRAYITNDSPGLPVPQHRHRIPSFIFRISLKINLVHVVLAKELVHRGIGILLVRSGESPPRPSLGIALWVGHDDAHIDDVC